MHLNKLTHTILLLMISFGLKGQIDLNYYFDAGTKLDPAIPTPESVLGWQIGEWHVSHDQMIRYVEALAVASPRVTLDYYGKSHEDRALPLLTITSQDNQANIEQLKRDHVALTDPSVSENTNTSGMPVVIWMGYSVHGNEASGSNAALLMAYFLAAAQGPEINNYLNNAIILMDMMLNPDGNVRFTTWVNGNKNKTLTGDSSNREQNEVWPGGRTNHYWFDLNRDWLLLQHPESRGRLVKYHEWKPNILTDHHEMGTNATFFFQPGIPSRNNPLTPERTFELTNEIAKFHIAGLDEIGSLYYSKESFDDFYYGKGSTYPDVNGAVGILFEQGSSRGHLQESINGDVSFPFTIKNQLETSMSTLKAGIHLREQLLDHQRNFYQSALKEAGRDSEKAVVFGATKDQGRLHHFIDLLLGHRIKVFELNSDVREKGHFFKSGQDYVVPFDQPQYRLIKSLFEQRTSFQDSLFYDVSAWTMPLAFNIPFTHVSGRAGLGNELKKAPALSGQKLGSTNYAYAFGWHEYYAPRALYRLQKKGIRTKLATKPFVSSAGRQFERGTIIIPLGNQKAKKQSIESILNTIASKDGITVHALQSGSTREGPDLGSASFSPLQKPEVLILVGRGTSAYESGEAWHLLDTRLDMPVSRIELHRFNNANLSRYNTIVMVNGNYTGISDRGKENLKEFVQNGGNIVATKSAVRWLANNEFTNTTFKSRKPDSTKQLAYDALSNASGAQVIGGAIFETKLDLTHPLAFGFEHEMLPVFRNHTMFMKRKKGRAMNPVVYTDKPLLAGYISDENEELLQNSAAVAVHTLGRGRIISMVDNPNFRAFWYGTNKLFFNALFFGDSVSASSVR